MSGGYGDALEKFGGIDATNDVSIIADAAANHPARFKASDEEVAEAQTKIATMAASRVFYPGGLAWTAKQAAPLRNLDAMFARMLPLKEMPLLEHEGPDPDPVEAALTCKAEIQTLVLATVYCPSWRISWIQNFLMTVIASCASVSLLTMQAVKGGPNTDCEIRFVEEAMRLLGFDIVTEGVATKGNGWRTPIPDICLVWKWRMRRQNDRVYTVVLWQYLSVKKYPETHPRYHYRAVQKQSKAPSLRRGVVISMPLHDIDGSSHEEYNDKLVKGIDAAIEKASTGWST